MRRRDLLKSVAATTVATATVRGDAGGSSDADVGAGAGRHAARSRPPAAARTLDGEGPVSLRALSGRIDPVRPARRLRGHGTPHDRPPEAVCDPDDPDTDPAECPDTLSRDASYLAEHPEVAATEDDYLAAAYDLGMAHRTDKGMIEAHRHPPGDAASMRSLVDRHREGNRHRWLFLNAKLMPTDPPFENVDFHERKKDLGDLLARERYDVAALCEVFWATGDPTDNVLANLGEANVRKAVKGPDKGTNLWKFRLGRGMDSGLLTLLTEFGDPPVDFVSHSEDPFEDDFWGTDETDFPFNLGWTHVEIDVGPGNVDLVHSHTAGGGNDPHTNRRNVRELMRAAARIRRQNPGNVTVVGGDLNIDYSGDFEDGGDLTTMFYEEVREAGFDDAWLTRGGVETSTHWGGLEEYPDDGYPRCRNYFSPGGGQCRCDDYVVENPEGTTRWERYRNLNHRLDFVLVEPPTAAHDLNLDLTRIRRRIFPRRDAAGPCALDPHDHSPGDMVLMSDHFGLEFETIASPR